MTSSAVRRIGERTFTIEDQRRFARISADCNPMHVDAVAARRLITGRPVVHGIHILLAAIEFLYGNTGTRPATLTCTFDNPVSIGERLVFDLRADGDRRWSVEAAVEGLICARILVEEETPGLSNNAADRDSTEVPTRLALLDQPLDEFPEAQAGRSFLVSPHDADGSGEFPVAHRLFGQQGFAALAALSYWVGMVCPGLHSVFAAVTVEFRATASSNGDMRFFVKRHDPRVQLYLIDVFGPFSGTIKAFRRPPPRPQPTVRELEAYVRPGEFRGTRSLIIGGSRGLGELTARILAAGGGSSVITYASGSKDAEAVQTDINRSCSAGCERLRFDVTSDCIETLHIDWSKIDAVYYFATPRIFRKRVEVFDQKLFAEFCDFYVGKFHELCAFLERSMQSKRIYCPSTVYVQERPRGLAEYAMAKAAAEVLSQDFNRVAEYLEIVCTRLPPLDTDQTASILKTNSGSSVDTMLEVVRAMSSS